MKEEAIITAKNLSFSYDNTLILEKVSFQIHKGEFIGIFGPNGGGKTTLLKLLMGFLEPLSGSIEICGSSPKQARSFLGYVPQIARFDRQFPITVFDIVLMGVLKEISPLGNFKKDSYERAKRALRKVGLYPKKNHIFGDLSGGEAQRVLIARAIASNPDILLLDEPTASVDTATENILYEILNDLRQETTILMVSHNLPAMTKRVDRCLLINRKSTTLAPEELCEHYTLGLYHPPISKNKG